MIAANRWYSVRGGYAYYCLFDKLGECRHFSDSIAFFVFFSFKGITLLLGPPLLTLGWKRLLLAEGPRQVLNAITLYSVAKAQNFSFDIHVYQQVFTTVQGVVLSFMLLTVVIWALSAIRLLVAGLLYWPLLVCHVRGNLKEYCCHKIDKRISQLLADRAQQRRNRPPELGGGDLKKAKTFTSASEASGGQPTLPKVELDGDGASILSMPLYPLSRTDSIDSRGGLLSRAESFGTGGLARTPTNMSGTSYPLQRMDSSSSQGYQLQRSDSINSNPYAPSRSETMNTTRYELNRADSRADSIPYSLNRSETMNTTRYELNPTVSNTYPLARSDTNTSASLTRGMSIASTNSYQSPGMQRQPTLPQISDFQPIPEGRRPPQINTRIAPVRGPPSQGHPFTGSRPPMSVRGYGPPVRSNTTDSAAARDRFGPPPRANTEVGLGPPPRVNMTGERETGFGPPPRSNTAGSMGAGQMGAGPVYDRGYGGGYVVPR